MRNVGMSPSMKDHVLEKALAGSAVKEGAIAGAPVSIETAN